MVFFKKSVRLAFFFLSAIAMDIYFKKNHPVPRFCAIPKLHLLLMEESMRFITSFLNWITDDTVRTLSVKPKAVLVPIRSKRIAKTKASTIHRF